MSDSRGFTLSLLLLAALIIPGLCSAASLHDQLYNKGVAHMQAGEYERAVENLQAAILMQPQGYKARYQLGLVYFSEGTRTLDPLKMGYAAAVWRKALETMPDESQLKSTLQDLLERATEREQTLMRMAQLQATLKAPSLTVEEGLEYASLLRNMGRDDEANTIYEMLVNVYRDDPQAYVALAEIAHQEGKLLWAKRYFENALNRDADYLPAKKGYKKLMIEMDGLRVEGYESMYESAHR